MKTLSRRTALAAVPLLAAATTMAGTARASASPTAVSPRLAELIKGYHWCKAEWRRLSDKLNDRNNVVKAAGLPRPDCYMIELECVEDRVWSLKGDLADKISVTRAETFADLQAQFDIWLDYYVEWNLDGTPGGISNMGGPELRFIFRLPDEIRRLAGAS